MTDDSNLHPSDRSAHPFTNEAIEDIVRFADEHGLEGVNAARLVAYIKSRSSHQKGNR
jgi:hypothetical protein